MNKPYPVKASAVGTPHLPIKILLVDDDQDTYRLTHYMLKRVDARRFELDWTDTFETAQVLIAQARHDIYLVDYRLGSADGLELLRWAIESGCQMPIIMLTGHEDPEVDLEATRAGAADYLIKGEFDAPMLERSIRYAIEQRRTLIALNRSQAQNRAIVNALPDLMFLLTPGGEIVDMKTGQFSQFLNLQPPQALGRKLNDILPVNRVNFEVHLSQLLATGQIQIFEGRFVLPIGERDLEFRLVLSEGQEILTLIRDITDLKLLESQLRQSQKMEAIGQLAGGIAHDFNNLLTAIIGYSQFLLNALEASSPYYRDVEQIKQAGDRAAALTRQLLAFSRRQIMQPKLIDLNLIISHLENLLSRLLGENIELTIRLEPQLSLVKADPGQIEQIILNLAMNARDAMPRGGNLTIETANVSLEKAYITEQMSLNPGQYAVLTMVDNGEGMDGETEAHLFEPFFTTKEQGKGAGLGLATVYGIVKQSSGDITVQTAPGQGTTFKIYLPFQRANSSAPLSPIIEKLQGSETVLLIEDEEVVRRLAFQTLSRYGYHVLEAKHAEEAQLICKTYEGEIDALVTDVVMPGLSGQQIAERLLRWYPQMKVLYISGYTDDHALQHGISEDMAHAFLQKPFTPKSLVSEVRQLLDARLGVEPGDEATRLPGS